MDIKKEKYGFNDLIDIIARLRDKDGCPWDAEQTHESIKKCMVEESYEVIEAIDSGNPEKIYDELGDLLMQVVFHAQIARENGEFDITDVTNAICTKMIRRHPHVFGTVKVNGSDEVLDNWEEIKKEEKGESTVSQTMESVAVSLPALMRAQKVQKKAAKAGFDWDSAQGAIDKIKEETKELETAIAENTNVEEEVGDILFSAVNAARLLKTDAEEALTKSTLKFMERFRKMEDKIIADGKNLNEMSLEEMDKVWDKVK